MGDFFFYLTGFVFFLGCRSYVLFPASVRSLARSLARISPPRVSHSPLLYLSLLSLISHAIPLSGILIVTRSRSSLALASFLGCLHHFRRRVSISRILPLCYVRFLLCSTILCFTFNSFRIAALSFFAISRFLERILIRSFLSFRCYSRLPSPPPTVFPTLHFLRVIALSLARPALPSRFISFFRQSPLHHVRTHVLPVSPSLSLSLPLFPVPTTKNVANVRIDRSLSRALPPFFTLLQSASPLLYLPLLFSLLYLLLHHLLFNLLRHPLYSSLRSPLPYSPSALHARTYFFCR